MAAVERLDFETIFEMSAMLRQQLLLPSFDATIDSDPAVIALQVDAYRQRLLRGRVPSFAGNLRA
jgi:hypothetical protein